MTEYEKERAVFYLRVVDSIKKGIAQQKYFYNIYAFDEGTGNLTTFAREKIMCFIKDMFPNDMYTDCLRAYNLGLYSDISLINRVKGIGKHVTMAYYLDKLREGSNIDLDMDIRNLNISSQAINMLKEKLSITGDIITLRDVLTITKQQVLDWDNTNRYNRKDVLDLVEFCNGIITCFFDSNDSENKELYQSELSAKCKKILDELSALESEYSEVHGKLKEYELLESDILHSIQKLRLELFEVNSIQANLNNQRKR